MTRASTSSAKTWVAGSSPATGVIIVNTGIGALAARALDRVDDRRGAQRRDDRRQVLYVFDLDIDHDFEEIGRAVGDLEIADVAALFADRRGQAAEVAGFVGDRDVYPADMRGVG